MFNILFKINVLNFIWLLFIRLSCLMPKFLSLPNILRVRWDFVRNSWLLLESTTKIGAKIAILSGAA